MDMALFNERIPLLLKHFNECGYCDTWHSTLKAECQRLLLSLKDYDTVDDYITAVQKSSCNGKVAWLKTSRIKTIVRYVIDNELPIAIKKKSTYSLTEGYKDLMSFALNKVTEQGLSEKTRQNYLDTMTTFFLHLESYGVFDLADVTEEIILPYFDGRVKRGHTTSRLVLRFLNLISDRIGVDLAKRVSSFIPKIQKQHKIYRGLTQSEREKVETVLLNGHPQLSYLDRAICALAFYTGMRACDITNLHIDNIDWDKEEISIVQIKTHRELRLKLLPCYGNLIYNYILNQRPKAKSRLIFLRTSNSQLNTHDTYRSTIKVLHAAGIDITNRTRGIHLLRHSLATSLIVRNTNLAVVTATLGHKSARATFTYLSSEVEGLRKCCLSSESFPINENYFSL